MSDDLCPPDDVLAAFLAGEATEDSDGAIASHLLACPRCELAAVRIDRLTGPLIAAIRRLGGASTGVATAPGPARMRETRSTVDDATGGWTGPPAGKVATGGPVAGPPGYTILGRLGGGGMGEVFRARHEKLGRVVALKLIRGATLAAVERFGIEAQAVARLQHPNIVQIYEVGEDEGRPFLSLEYVAGGSLDQALQDSPRPARQVAEMVRAMAAAVHHAHGRGIIHRDLKPANVLLADPTDPHAPGPVPKITDFGIARLSDADSAMTREGDILGTPAYMAPEQAEGRVDRIGPATDVYSLGVILYEMMTGGVPFRGLDAIQTLLLVRTQDPVAPRRLNPKLPRDLETICLRCLAKEPGRRYASASDLADDLGRWLEGRPILARPVGALARLGLWARRRPAIAALSAAVAAVAMAGLGTVVAVEVRARRAAERSAAREAARFDVAAEAIGTFHSEVSQDLLLKQKGFADTRVALLKQARDFYARLGALLAGQEDGRSRTALAASYQKLGDLELEIGRKAEAGDAYARGLALREALAREPDSGPEAIADVARMLLKLGEARYFAGDPKEALSCFERGRGLLEPVVRDRPGVARFRYDLADLLNDLSAVRNSLGKADEARASMDQARAFREELVRTEPGNEEYRDKLVQGLYNRGVIEPDRDRRVALFTRAEEQRRLLVEARPAKLAWKADLGRIVLALGQERWAVDDLAGTLARLGQARDLLESVIQQSPEVEIARYDLIKVLALLGGCQVEARRVEEGCRSLDRAAELLERLIRDNPKDGFLMDRMANAVYRAAIAHALAGRGAEASARFERAAPLVVHNRLGPDGGMMMTADIEAYGGYVAWRLGRLAPGEAVARIDAALARVRARAEQEPYFQQLMARYHAMRSALGSVAGGGRSAEDGRLDREAAAEALRRVARARLPAATVLAEPWFAPLRDDPALRLLPMDLAMPPDPFAAPR